MRAQKKDPPFKKGSLTSPKELLEFSSTLFKKDVLLVEALDSVHLAPPEMLADCDVCVNKQVFQSCFLDQSASDPAYVGTSLCRDELCRFTATISTHSFWREKKKDNRDANYAQD